MTPGTDDTPVPAFTDKLGRVWPLEPSIELFNRTKAVGVDLLDIATTQESLRQLQDPYTLAAVLEAACEPIAQARGLTPSQWREGLNGDVLNAGEAALQDCAVFFSRREIRPTLTVLVATARKAEARMAAQMAANLGRIQAVAEQALEQLATSCASVTSSPESSASTPDPGASARSPGRRGASSRKTGSKLPLS